MNLQEIVKKINSIENKDLIKLHTIDPDIPIDKSIISKTNKFTGRNGYTPSEGLKELKTSLAKRYGVCDENVIIGCGSRHLLFGLGFSLVKNNKKILIPDPEWAHDSPTKLFTKKNDVIRIEWSADEKENNFVKKLINRITKNCVMLVLSNPNNPTGRVLSIESIKKIIRACEKNQCYFIEDRAYEGLSFSKIASKIFSKYHVILGTFSKTYSMAGYRVGYVVSIEKEISDELINFVYDSIQCIPFFTQKGATRALELEQQIKSKVIKIYKQRLSVAEKILLNYKIDYIKPRSAPFLYINTNKLNSELLAMELLKRKIAVAPSTAFSHSNNFLRITLMEDKIKIKRAMIEIASLIGKKTTPFQDKIIKKYYSDHKKYKPYFTDIFKNIGIKKFYVGKNILRPDKSWVSYFLTEFLVKNLYIYKNKKILDLGSGSGIQGIACALNGAERIFMTDIEDSAIDNIKENVKLFNLEKKVKIIKSDLFAKLEKNKFDVIIFNHPFFPYEPHDAISKVILSGPKLLKKFFKTVNNYLNKGGIIIMPFSHLAPFYNNPINFIDKYKYEHAIIEISNQYGRHSIYIISKNKQIIQHISKKLKGL